MRRHADAGFSLPELLIAMTIMLIISGAAVSALLKMTAAQATIWNRTQMHSGIRGATEPEGPGTQMQAIASTLPDEQAASDVVAYINTLR